MTKPFKAQLAGVREMVWSGNGLTFDTQEEAKQYAMDLLSRWSGADMARVVSSDTPDRESVDLADPQIVANYRR